MTIDPVDTCIVIIGIVVFCALGVMAWNMIIGTNAGYDRYDDTI